MGSKPVDNRKGKGSDRENRGTGSPKRKSGEHRRGKQGGNKSSKW